MLGIYRGIDCIVWRLPVCAHHLARFAQQGTVLHMRQVLLLPVVLALVVSCTSAGEPLPTTNPASPSTIGTDPAQEMVSRFEGLLAVDADSGDLLEFASGGWSSLLDGPSYSDESAQYFIETATRFSGSTVVSYCCEPVVGALASVESGSSSFFGYGTRPSSSSRFLVSFKDLYLDVDGVSVLVYDSTSPDSELREILLKGVSAHGSSIHVDGNFAYFTWTPKTSGAPWYLSGVDLSKDGDQLVAENPSVRLPYKMDLASAKSLIAYPVESDATPAYEIPIEGFEKFDFSSAEPVAELPAKTSSAAFYAKDWVAVAESGMATSDSALSPALIKTSVSWVGW